MAEQDIEQVHSGAAVLDIGEDIGALIIYTREHLRGQEIEVSRQEDPSRRTHTAVLERRVNGRSIFAALFLSLAAGDYIIWTNDPTVANTVTVVGGQVAEVDWRASATLPSFASAHHHHGPGGVHNTSSPPETA